MKGLVITTLSTMYVKEFSEPLHISLGAFFDGFFEHVLPKGLPAPFCMIVDEDGLHKKRPSNFLGCLMYQTYTHGNPIVGDIVIMRDGFINGEHDIVGLTDYDIKELQQYFITISCRQIKLVEDSNG